MRRRLIALTTLIVASCGSGQIEPVTCGDGVVDGSEQCDDANRLDGDGCSANCQLEDPDQEFTCVESFAAPEIHPYSGAMAASVDSTIVVGGAVTNQLEEHGWIGAFDTQGAPLWALDLEDDDYVGALRARDDGFLALVRGADQFRIIEIDASGVLGNETVLATDARPYAMLDTPNGLLLAGDIRPGSTSARSDLWLGRLGADATIEVLMTEDHAGWEDSFLAIEQVGDTIGVLASVGLINRTDGDILMLTVEGTMFIEYDESLVETRRTLFADEDQLVSWSPHDIVGAPDGTWIIAGEQQNKEALTEPRFAWAAGVRGGQLVWSHTIESADVLEGFPHASLVAGAVIEHAFLVGALETDVGTSQLTLRLDPQSGAIIERADLVVGGDGPNFTGLSTTTEDRGWFVGHATSDLEEALWLCSARL